jgi:hypothetical protein
MVAYFHPKSLILLLNIANPLPREVCKMQNRRGGNGVSQTPSLAMRIHQAIEKSCVGAILPAPAPLATIAADSTSALPPFFNGRLR